MPNDGYKILREAWTERCRALRSIYAFPAVVSPKDGVAQLDCIRENIAYSILVWDTALKQVFDDSVSVVYDGSATRSGCTVAGIYYFPFEESQT